MNKTASVFVVQHLHVIDEHGHEDVKFIGVYASRRDAEGAVARLAQQPGFNRFPKILDPLHGDEENGFFIDEYRVGEDHWTEGFVTVP